MLSRSKSGIGYYLDNLLQALARIDHENQYTLFDVSGQVGQESCLPSPGLNFAVRRLRFPNGAFVRLFRDSSPAFHIMRQLSRGYDLVHEPGYEPLPVAPRSVLTIHDMIFFRLPEQYPSGIVRRYQRRLRDSARIARQIITDSDQTRRDVIALLPVPPEKVHTIPLGVSPQDFAPDMPNEQIRRVLAALGLDKPFLLSLGDLYQRKNNISLVRAFARLPDDLKRTYQLVIAGAPKEARVLAELEAEIEASGLRESVRITGYVDDITRTLLLTRAAALLYPSLYEGFGLPPLEAMACGVPAVCANNSSIPEVVGEAALLVQEYQSADAWAEAITRVLSDTHLRKGLIAQGRERVKAFTWERTARQTLEIYERAIADE